MTQPNTETNTQTVNVPINQIPNTTAQMNNPTPTANIRPRSSSINRSANTTTHTIANTPPSSPIRTILIHIDQVRALDFSPILQTLGLDVVPRGEALADMMGRSNIHIQGYADPRNTYFREFVQRYFYELNKVWSYWFFFANLRFSTLHLIHNCLVNMENHTLAGSGSVFRSYLGDQYRVSERITQHCIANMERLMGRAQMPQAAIDLRRNKLLEYLDVPSLLERSGMRCFFPEAHLYLLASRNMQEYRSRRFLRCWNWNSFALPTASS